MFERHSFFLTRKISFIFKYLFKQPFINVEINEENIIENSPFFYLRWSLSREPELEPDLHTDSGSDQKYWLWLRNTDDIIA